MASLKAALLWALAMLTIALSSRLGWIAQDMATTLLIVLPALAIVSLNGGARCRLRSA